jgi:diguanylate cyclase (GGDEF)-like protein
LDENEEIAEYISIRNEITELIKQKEYIEEIANSDSLTGLGNRLKLINDINSNENSMIAILNIDAFREINDFYGITFGDTLLKKFANSLKNRVLNENYSVYRLQSDEFVILSTSTHKDSFIDDINTVLNQLKKDRFLVDGELIVLNMTTSISFEPKDTLLISADIALKSAKRESSDLIIYNSNMPLNKEYKNNIIWTKKLRSALLQDRIKPFFQPIVNNRTMKFEKYESLVRLIDEDGKVISPFFFLEVSKKSKQYISLSKIVIDKTFETFKDKDFEFSINLTVDDILNKDLQLHIFETLKKYSVGSRAIFEIVESESINNFEEVIKFINKVKEFDAQIAIDDFGTGYSNFEYLMKLNADFIKIDGSMIKNIDKDENSKIVVTTIVDFAKKMNMKTVAEFVENESILNVVKELGIDYSQGYHFSPPVESLDKI